MKKVILHLCADIGSDSWFYQQNPDYEVIKIGKEIGIENYNPPENVHGIIANPVCTEFQTINGYGKINNIEKGMFLVNHCMRIIKITSPKWWILENPARGELRKYIGKPIFSYHPFEYGDPWTKYTALWGEFNIPMKTHTWESCIRNKSLYCRPGRNKPNLTFMHKSAIDLIPEFQKFKPYIKTDADFRSLCSQGFAKAFYEANK